MSDKATDAPGAPLFRPGFFSSPTVKVVLIGFVVTMLMIPSTFVWVLVEERAGRARDVANEISRSWGGAQSVNGPYLVIPVTETKLIGTGENQVEKTYKRTVLLFPEDLEIEGNTEVEERQLSIYAMPVYQSRMSLAGRFAPPPDSAFSPEHAGTVRADPDKAFLVVGIGDLRALRNDVSLALNSNTTRAFEPGLRGLKESGHPLRSGIHAPIKPAEWRSGFTFEVDLKLNGSRSLSLSPAGQTTKVSLASDWPHPGFAGTYLPDERSISEDGHEASWTIPYLARGLEKVIQTNTLPLSNNVVRVNFIEPVNFYQTVSRSLKYAIGFFCLTFLAVFILELRSGWNLHWIQYGLVGLALVVFYVLLLALAEHIGYGRAYLFAAGAIALMVAFYVGAALKSRLAGSVMLLVMAAVYGVLYALMREQDYALLIGAVIAFAALAVTMQATLRIDWSASRRPDVGTAADA